MKESLFSEFLETSTDEWNKEIRKTLKDSESLEKLIWHSYENIDFQPFYRKEDLNNLEYLVQSVPGIYPYIRGNKTRHNDWKICEEIIEIEPLKINEAIVEAKNNGADSFIIDGNTAKSPKAMDLALSGIDLLKNQINFKTTSDSKDIIKNLIKFAKNCNFETTKLEGSLFYDPFKTLVLKGHDEVSKQTHLEEIESNIELTEDNSIPYNVLTVHSYPFKSAGSNIVQELAFSLCSSIEYLTLLIERGLNVDKICRHILFSFSISSNYFMEIAKLRAARLLWSKIVEQFNPVNVTDSKMKIHCHSSHFNKTIYDPYVNILRESLETMASAIGGADSIHLNPFDNYYKYTDTLSKRIARNTQLVIKNESYLDKVVDPAAGSYYLEILTKSISEESLKLILEVENHGGFLSALKKGFIQNKIAKNKNKLKKNISTRKEVFVGTNQYPNPDEQMFEEFIYSEKEENFSDHVTEIEPLRIFRATEDFENVRLNTEKKIKESGKNIKVFLFPIGNQGMRKARANFAFNFFGCGGFEVIDNPGFSTIDQGVKEVSKNNCDIVVICSSDDEYPELAPKIKNQLSKLNPAIKVIIAGFPKKFADDLLKIGIDDFIHIRSNALEILEKYQKI